MKPDKFNPFRIESSENREPWQLALDDLLALELGPGDEIKQSEISEYLRMVPFDGLSSRQVRTYDLSRLPQVEKLREAFETETGLIMWATGRGSYVLLHPNEVAENVQQAMSRDIAKTLKKGSDVIKRAGTEGVSDIEAQARKDVIGFIGGTRDYLRRARVVRRVIDANS